MNSKDLVSQRAEKFDVEERVPIHGLAVDVWVAFPARLHPTGGIIMRLTRNVLVVDRSGVGNDPSCRHSTVRAAGRGMRLQCVCTAAVVARLVVRRLLPSITRGDPRRVG